MNKNNNIIDKGIKYLTREFQTFMTEELSDYNERYKDSKINLFDLQRREIDNIY